MAGQSKEQRRYQRVRLKPGKWVAVRGGGRTRVHRCTLMGLGGMFLQCSDPLPVGSVLRFAFEVGAFTVSGTATVRTTCSGGIGLGFISMKTGDRANMYAFLKSRRSKR